MPDGVELVDPLLQLEAHFGLERTVDGREPLVVPAGPKAINNIGIVSGAATDDVLTALDEGLDAFLTGEPAERAYSIATEPMPTRATIWRRASAGA